MANGIPSSNNDRFFLARRQVSQNPGRLEDGPARFPGRLPFPPGFGPDLKKFPPPPPFPPQNFGNGFAKGLESLLSQGLGNLQGFDFSKITELLQNGFSQFGTPGQTQGTIINTVAPESTTPTTQTTQQTNTQTGTGPNVVVVDQTSIAKAGIDIDGDRVNDVAHGTIVGNFIKSGLPNANVSTVELPDYEAATLTSAFNGLAQRIDGGEKVDAVNFSAQTFSKIPDLAKVTGLALTKDNLAQNKDEIRNRLFTLAQNPTAFGGDKALAEEFTQFVPVIQAMDKITARNVPLYVAAGNDGKDQINLFSLVNGAQVIGATDANGNKTDYTADNSLITQFTRGNTPVTPVKDAAETVIGAEFTGDGKIDIAANQLSGKGQKFGADLEVSGTSFASPKALADDLAKRGLSAGINALA